MSEMREKSLPTLALHALTLCLFLMGCSMQDATTSVSSPREEDRAKADGTVDEWERLVASEIQMSSLTDGARVQVESYGDISSAYFDIPEGSVPHERDVFGAIASLLERGRGAPVQVSFDRLEADGTVTFWVYTFETDGRITRSEGRSESPAQEVRTSFNTGLVEQVSPEEIERVAGGIDPVPEFGEP